MPEDSSEFPPGAFPVYEGDNIQTIVTGLIASRIRQAEEDGIVLLGSTEQYLGEIDSAATDDERVEIQTRWNKYRRESEKERAAADFKEYMRRAKEAHGDEDFDIPDEEM